MSDAGPRPRGWTRRTVLLGGSALAVEAKEPALPAEWARYPDPATEFEVLRLTDPNSECVLPRPPARVVARNSGSILVVSPRTGSPQVFRIDVGNGTWRQITWADQLLADSVTFSSDDRGVFFAAAGSLRYTPTSGWREQEVCRIRDGFALREAPAVSTDAQTLFFVEAGPKTSEVRRVRFPRGTPETVFSFDGQIRDLEINPRRAMLCWRSETGELWVSAWDGSLRRRVETPAGTVRQALWSPDGRAILYLLAPPPELRQLIAIREQDLDGRSDKLIATTTQFAAFSRNANASVFLGASGTKASPHVLLLLRATRREFTLCEHRSSDPQTITPIFAPNSQRIFFQSDRHGKPAIYTMLVEKIVEKTEDETSPTKTPSASDR